MATQLWMRLIKNTRIAAQATEPCTRETPAAALRDICQRMDLPQPMWMSKNEHDWAEFGQTRFLPSAFMETVSFDRMEIQFIDTEAPKRRSNDPRNA